MIRFENISAVQSIGIPLEEVEARRHNLWVGISFGNKTFTTEHIRSLLLCALHFTKGKVLVWIPGRMQAINFHYFDNISRADALKKAFVAEDEKRREIETILATLPEAEQKKISVANYDDICTPLFIKRREVLFREFSEQEDFYLDVVAIVKEVVQDRQRTETKKLLENLSLYILQELPLFLNGVQTLFDKTLYSVCLYPGMGKLDDLVNEIWRGKKYAGLRKKLSLKEKVGIVDIRFEK